MPYSNWITDQLSYPKSRDAIASKNAGTDFCDVFNLFANLNIIFDEIV